MKDCIINGDCIKVMAQLPSKSVDLILCDLPYGVTQNKADIVIPFADLWQQYNRIIKDRGAILLFGQGLFFIDLVNSNRKMFRYDLVWDKELISGFLNAKKMPLRQHEQIAVFYKKLPTYNPQFTKGNPLHSRGALKNKRKNNNYGEFADASDDRKGCRDKYPTSILRFKKPHPSVCVHPTQKPVTLLENLIKTYTNPGDTVLDNCIGSGSTIFAAANTERHYIGIDINKSYCDTVQEKLQKQYLHNEERQQ